MSPEEFINSEKALQSKKKKLKQKKERQRKRHIKQGKIDISFNKNLSQSNVSNIVNDDQSVHSLHLSAKNDQKKV